MGVDKKILAAKFLESKLNARNFFFFVVETPRRFNHVE